MSSKAVVILQDGTVFHGRSTGLDGTAFGEICFNTGMTGYQEIFTDPSYKGQLMVTTTAHIGNYGIVAEESENAQVQISGLIVRNFSEVESRPRAEGKTLAAFFKEQNKVAIADVDTRALVRHIREHGAQNAVITTEVDRLEEIKMELNSTPSMEGLALCPDVSTKEVYAFGEADAPLHVAALDLGIKKNILRCLTEVGCRVTVFPHNTSFEAMAATGADGFFLSNGPGDPSASPEVIEVARSMISSGKPTFGICLGHQMIALASGMKTYKMHNGHRGINHPVKNLATGKGEITSQNHGFAVAMEDVEKHAHIELTHVHLNDGTVAGIRRTDAPVFSVQYHPEASPGPHDSRYLFQDFVTLMNVKKK